MFENTRLSAGLKVFIAIFVAIAFAVLCIVQIKGALVISFTLVLLPIIWISAKHIDEKTFLLFFFLVYPLLPTLWGVRLVPGLPVFKAHRVFVMLLLFYLVRRRMLGECFGQFFRANIFTFSLLMVIASYFMTGFFFSQQIHHAFFCNIVCV